MAVRPRPDRPAAARTTYERDGCYLWPRPLLPAEVVAGAAAGMEALMRGEYETGEPPQASYWNPGDPADKLVKIEMPQLANRAIMALCAHPALGRAAAEVTGARMVQVWWVQMLIKPPAAPDGAGPQVGWHQDRQYWQQWAPDSELFTAWVACSDVTADAGPVRYVRGSHRWGQVRGDFFAPDAERQREAIAVPPGETWDEVAGVLPPGGVVFHDRRTLHGSGENRSGRPRRSFALHMRTERSRPAGPARDGLLRFIDDPSRAPVIFGPAAR